MKDNIKTISASLLATGLKVAIVVSRWHELVTAQLVSGAIDTIVRHGGSESDITMVYVPGTHEIPLATQQLARTGQYDAIVTLGVVIRGGTLHFELIANDAFRGISQISLEHNIPIGIGILTTEDLDQAISRAGGKQGNKGIEATLAAIEMANLAKTITNK